MIVGYDSCFDGNIHFYFFFTRCLLLLLLLVGVYGTGNVHTFGFCIMPK